MTMTDGFFLGMLGGAVPEFFALWQMRKDFHKNKPVWLTSWFYWVMTLIMILLGGGLVCLYMVSGTAITVYLALHIGVSAPVLIGTATKGKISVG